MADNLRYHGKEIVTDKNGKVLRAMTRGQDKLIDTIENNDIIFVNGPAGCGKTAIATWMGIAAIDDNRYERLVLTRPIVEAGESLGFLPGTFEEKVAPYMQPLFEAISRIKGGNPEDYIKGGISNHTQKVPFNQPVISNYKKKKLSKGEIITEQPKTDFYKKVNVCPLAYLRGATKDRTFAIIDESQNITSSQMYLILSRIGQSSKFVLTGDGFQLDRLDRGAPSGFIEAQRLLKGIPRIASITLTSDDIVRNPLIKKIIMRYEKKNSYLTNTEGNRNYTDRIDYEETSPHDESIELPEDNVDEIPFDEPDYENLPPPKVKKIRNKKIVE